MVKIILPFRAEYFKGWSKGIMCQNQECRQRYNFEVNELLLALVVQPSSLTKNVTFQWYHFKCFFYNHKPECVGDIDYFESLRWDDQKKIKKKMKKLNSTSTSKTRSGTNQEEVQDYETIFQIAYCKYQVKCEICKQHIERGQMRVFKITTNRGYAYPYLHYHLHCFINFRGLFGFPDSGETLEVTVIDESTDVDALLDERLKKADSVSTDGMHPYILNALPEIELDNEALKMKIFQNKIMHKIRNRLALCSWNTMAKLLKENGQDSDYFDTNSMLDRLADAMTFGALKRCLTCKTGQLDFHLSFSGMSYYCMQEDEWSRCGSYFDEPPRRPFVVPNDVKKDEQDIRMQTLWEQYDQAEIKKRVFERNPPSASTFVLNRGYKSDTEVQTRIPWIFIDISANARKKRVYRDEKGNTYSAFLTLTDLQVGKNSYCKIQVLHSPYAFFQSWGEIEIPHSTKEEITTNVHFAVRQFESVFQQQTGNSWTNRRTFKKVPGKKFWLDLLCGQQNVADDDKTGEESFPILEKSVEEFVKRLYFGPTVMNDAIGEMELDFNEMSLGEPSRKQMKEANDALQTLLVRKILMRKDDEVYQKMVLSLSNKFYTLIPYKFTAVDSSLLLNTKKAIKQKQSRLSISLVEIPLINSYYRNLKTKLQPVDETELVFKILKKCVQKTHANFHDHYTLDIVRIFEVERQGEDVCNERFKTLSNKRLLWHGSLIKNFTRILSQGLRILPPGSAARTGDMFGQGIYFSDMVSKAANYCHANENSDNNGLLLLCEVTLGHMKHLFKADPTLKNPPQGYNSVKGVGLKEPSPLKMVTLYEGVELASGYEVHTSVNPELVSCTELLYNEYIVYDKAQIKIKYLLQVKFNYEA